MDESFDRIGVGALYTMIVDAEDEAPTAAASSSADLPLRVVYGMGDDAEVLPVSEMHEFAGWVILGGGSG